jgi:hypothetical protein
MPTDQDVFWEIVEELQAAAPRVSESTIMGGRCVRVGGEFLALVDYEGSGLVIKLPKALVAELIESGTGKPFGPGKKIFGVWASIPTCARRRWRSLLDEGIAFVAPADS